MAAMSTALTELSASGNSRTYYFTGHTALKPRLVIQKKKFATGSQVVIEDNFQVVYTTIDSLSNVLPQKIAFEVNVRRPISGASADVTAAQVVLRDIVASDEFAALVTGQNWLKP
jgi:hypothetical protein